MCTNVLQLASLTFSSSGLDCPPPERRRISSGEVQGSVTEELIPPNLPAAALLQLALSSPDLDGLGLAATAQENCAMLDQMSQHPAEDLPTSLLYWHTGVEQQHAHRTLALLGGLEYSCELLDGGAITWCQHEPGRARLVTNTELQASVTTKGGTQLEMETELPKELAAWCDLMRIPKLDCSNIHPTLLTLGSKLWESELELTVPFHQEIPLSFPLLSDPAGPVVREQPIAWVVRVYDDLSVTIPVQHHGVEDSIDCQIQAGDCPEEVALSYCQNLALDSRTCSMLVKEFNSQVWGLGRCFACRDCDCGDAPMQGIQRPLRKLGEKESSF
ncbi:unnamed protein product [Chrysoparadoxa australica]